MEFHFRDFLYPVAIGKLRLLYERAQWYPPETLRQMQDRMVAKIIRHCYENVPYYRRIMDSLGLVPADIRKASDLVKLPILRKEDIREHFDELVAKNSKRYSPKLSRTSGSTGTALSFYWDKFTNALEFATLWFHWSWGGYRFGDRFVDLRGRVIEDPRGWRRNFRLNSLDLSSFNLTRKTVVEYVKQLRRFKPVIIRGYPSSIDIMAHWMREMGVDDIRPKAVLTSSETLLAHQRKNISEVFGCKVFDAYSMMEHVCFVGECEQGSMHVFSPYGVLEVVDEAGIPVSPGQKGRILGTGFHNMTMPLLRYDTKDFCFAGDGGRCPCGRGFPTISGIEGRIEDVVVTPDGRHVGRLDAAFRCTPGIKYSQIVQETIDRIEVRIVKAKHFSEKDVETLLAELKKRLGDAVSIELRYVDQIPQTRPGKFKFVISKVHPDVKS